MFLSKYGVARHIYVPVIKRAVVDFAVSADWTPAAGDVKISKDGGAAANVTNLPTAITMGNGAMWDFSLTATEMQAAQVMITVVDSATKAVEDQMFIIETYGNASAEHAVDLSDSVRAGLTALPNATPGAAGGVFIAGTNAAVTINGTAAAGAAAATAALTLAGGAASTTGGGTAAAAIKATGGAGAATTNGAAEGANITAGGTTTVSGNDGMKVNGSGNGNGLTLVKAGSGQDFNATSTPLVLAKTTNITGFNDLTSAAVTNAVWDAVLSGHLTAGTTGAALNGAGSAGDPWLTALPGAYGAGSAGNIVGNNLNATVSSRLASASITLSGGAVTVGTNNDKTGYALSGAGVQAIWDALTSALTTAGSIGKRLTDFITGDAFVRLGAPAGASVSADIAAIKSDTGTILTDVNTGAGAIYTRLGAPAGASLAADIAAINSKTTNLPAAPAATGDAMALTVGAVHAVWDEVVDGTFTARQAARLWNSALAGKADGMATTTVHFRDLADTKNRITATVDASGNRSAVTTDVT